MRFDWTIMIAASAAAFSLVACGGGDDTGLSQAPVGAGTGGVSSGGVTGTGNVPVGTGGLAVNTGGAYYPTGGTTSVATGGAGNGGVASGGAGGVATGGGSSTGGAPPSDDPECDLPIEFHARTDATGKKFHVAANTIDLYECFAFKVDVPAGAQALKFEPMIDNKKIVHHYLLYKMTVAQADGVTSPCIGLHRDGLLIDGWAPGQNGVKLPDDVGMDIGDGNFMLEIHYNNFGGDVDDNTGVRMCATKTPKKNTATVSWLGTEAIFIPPATKALDITSRCAPPATGPINVIRSWPHMHLLGRNMKADIVRSGGAVENLFNHPFDFNSQIGYETPAVLNPGDSIVTTCTFENTNGYPVTFGEGTQSEMCYNFTFAYPANALVSTGLHSTSCNN